jgi:hypothetical protein
LNECRKPECLEKDVLINLQGKKIIELEEKIEKM